MKALWTLLLLLFATTVYAAPCTITGTVFNPDGTPLANGTVQFNSVVQQTLQGGAVIPPQFISTTTDAGGNLAAFSVVQGLQGQFTFCSPSAGGCGNPTPVLIPISTTADISAILIGIQLQTGGNINAASLNVSGNSTMGGTLVVTGPTTLGTASIATLNVTGVTTFNGQVVVNATSGICFPDQGCWNNGGIQNVTHVGIGAPAPLGSVGLQIGPSASLSSAAYTDGAGNPQPNYTQAAGVHMNASGQWIADVAYPMWFNMVGNQTSSAENGSEFGMFVFGPQTIGQPATTTSRVQYLAVRPNEPGVSAGLYLESGGIDVINGGITANGGSLGSGIYSTYSQNGATWVQSVNNDSTDASAAAVVRASTGISVTDLGTIGPSANLGGFFSPNRGYVASDAAGGLLIEATGTNAYLYLSAPNANKVLVIGNQHFGTSNDGISVPTANAAACGGSGAVFGTSTDTSGSVNIGPTAVNSCVVTFAAAYPSVACVCSTRANTWCSITPSASGFSMGFGANITGYASWICWENGE